MQHAIIRGQGVTYTCTNLTEIGTQSTTSSVKSETRLEERQQIKKRAGAQRRQQRYRKLSVKCAGRTSSNRVTFPCECFTLRYNCPSRVCLHQRRSETGQLGTACSIGGEPATSRTRGHVVVTSEDRIAPAAEAPLGAARRENLRGERGNRP